MRRTTAAIGTVAVVGLLAVGCGSSSSDSKDDPTTTTAMAAESPMTDAELSELLLTPSEVGTGWTADTSSSSGGGSNAPSCLKNIQGNDTSIADAEASYENGETVFAFEGLGAQETAEDAEAAWELVTQALDDCTDVSITSNGETIPGTITANGEVDFGDGAKSYTMDFTSQGVPVGIDVVVAYTGQVDVIVMYGTLGTADPGAVDTMAEAAIEKITGASA